ncbi:hypothetical protein ACFSJW_02310 [Flavobacterium artemisiae]|uniref:Uncharacterized protein n=1 Tax=Flavobacterium artemisiae TaxID=2126556 RepID=A0ABW4HJY4_9FLAO
MENSKINPTQNCNSSNLRMFHGEDNEMICLKICKGDWGDWDDTPENTIQNTNIDADNTSMDINSDNI